MISTTTSPPPATNPPDELVAVGVALLGGVGAAVGTVMLFLSYKPKACALAGRLLVEAAEVFACADLTAEFDCAEFDCVEGFA